MRFLVLGASGMAGHVIAIYLREKGHDVVGLTRKPVSFVQNITLDAEDAYALRRVVEDGNYDVVVNAIGLLNQEAEDFKASAVYLNAYLPHYLASITRNSTTRIFHMSTDCVFAGNTGPYTEKTTPDGRTFYDRTKALGELVDHKNMTFRNSIVGPDISPNGIGLFNWFMKQSGTVDGYVKAMWNGITTIELARAMMIAAEGTSTGLVNLVPDAPVSKYELLCMFNQAIRGGELVIRPKNPFVLDKTLKRENEQFPYKVRNYASQISTMREWIIDHQYLYPHYRIRG